jgi:hypothetical protein
MRLLQGLAILVKSSRRIPQLPDLMALKFALKLSVYFALSLST